MFGVRGVGEDVHQLRVTPHASAVLRWGSPPATDTARVRHGRITIEDLFHQDVVLPTVTEIVGVVELVVHGGSDLLQVDP